MELQSSVRRKCGKAKVDCDQSVTQEDMAIDECDEDQHQTETSIQPGKDGTIWKNQKQQKNVKTKSLYKIFHPLLLDQQSFQRKEFTMPLMPLKF